MIELTIEEDGSVVSATISKNNVSPTTTYKSLDNLPEELKTKVSVLRLSDTYQDIDGIGQKVTDKLFWVYEDANDKYMSWSTDSLTMMVALTEAKYEKVSVRSIFNQLEQTNDQPRNVLSRAEPDTNRRNRNLFPRNNQSNKSSGTRGKSDSINRQIRLFAVRQTNRRSRGRLR